MSFRSPTQRHVTERVSQHARVGTRTTLVRSSVKTAMHCLQERTQPSSRASRQHTSGGGHADHRRGIQVLSAIGELYDVKVHPEPARHVLALHQDPVLVPRTVFKREGSKGVCVLGVPFVAETDPYAESTAYIETLCKWCPSLRLQNIFCQGMANDGELLCREQWIIDAVTWDRFCATCVKLKTFNWTVVPFSTEFFHIFAKHRKPELRELDIAAPGNWNWAQYFTETKADASKGYGWTAKDVSAVLTACPILRRLSIHISNQGLGSRANMDQELFGDDFIEALVRYCPVLQMLQITNYNNDAQQDHTIMTFTDRSLRALATL